MMIFMMRTRRSSLETQPALQSMHTVPGREFHLQS